MCHDLSEHTVECVLLAIISHIFVGKIDWMHVSHVFMVFCLGLFALFGCFGNGIICYSIFHLYFSLGQGTVACQKSYLTSVLGMIFKLFHQVCIFFLKACMNDFECKCMSVDIEVFKFALTSCSSSEGKIRND